MSLLRTFQQLLPDAAAWRLTVPKRLRSFFEGLAGGPQAAREFIDDVSDDLYPATTRELAAWEAQFALHGNGSDEERRSALAAAWQATGGQSPRYLQDALHAAGFEVYVHEWWSSGPPYVPRDPRLHTNQPVVGTVQCGEPLAQCGEASALCNRFLANEPGYIVNLTLQPTAPPPVPSSPLTWPFFVYVGGETFGTRVVLPESRRGEFEEKLLELFPTQHWIVTLVDYLEERVTVSGETRVTAGAETRVIPS